MTFWPLRPQMTPDEFLKIYMKKLSKLVKLPKVAYMYAQVIIHDTISKNSDTW